MAGLFERDEIRAALTDVAQLLERQGVSARIFIVGGAALALAHYDRPATGDVDAVFAPADLVVAAAARVGRSRGYPPDWLNDAAKIFVPVHGEHTGVPFLEVGSVSISVAPADLLLAMKLLAGRGRRDFRDITFLVEECEVKSVEHARRIFESFFPDHEPTERGIAAVEAALRG